jgi:glycine/D-amino acid oxidase-like deaminating enzyme
VDRPQTGAELEPDIDPAVIGDAPVAYFPEEGWLDRWCRMPCCPLRGRRRGAKVICGARVADLVMTADRVSGVRLVDGTRHAADMVVNCAGRWTNEAVREAGLHLPLAPTVGFLVFTPPVAASLNRVVRTTVIDARPDGAGRLMLHWNPTDAIMRFDSTLGRPCRSARSGAAGAPAAANDRRRGAGGSAHRHPADPRRSSVRHRTDAAHLRLLSGGHA